MKFTVVLHIGQPARIIVAEHADGGALHIQKATCPETELATIYQALKFDPLSRGMQKTYA